MPSPLRTAAVLLAVALPACGLAQCGGDAKPAAKAEATPRPAGSACTVHVDPASFVGEFSAAEPGDVLCLASGRYQPFVGAEEADKVTIRAEKGARPRLPFDFDGATNLVLEGLTIPLGRLAGATRDITIRDSAFTGPLTIEGLADANVLLEHNTHLDIDAPPGASPARIHLNYSARAPSGVTIRDSLFAGGDADGIQTGVGVEIVDNEFRDILEKGPNHTDAIQLIGARGQRHPRQLHPRLVVGDRRVRRGRPRHDRGQRRRPRRPSLGGRALLRRRLGRPPQHARARRVRLRPPVRDPRGQPQAGRPARPRHRGHRERRGRHLDPERLHARGPEREPAGRVRRARGRRGRDARLRGRREPGPLGRIPARRLLPRRRRGVRRRRRRHPHALTRRRVQAVWTHWTH